MNIIISRATVVLQVEQILILGSQFVFISHMDQQIETIAGCVTVCNSRELLVMKQQKFVDAVAKPL
ncbi:MAG TPA: hypothetical protein VNX70_02105 [Bryobacteraceae bacterium]|nr:hypothetical protein [Bryobacteraceae bacterium]